MDKDTASLFIVLLVKSLMTNEVKKFEKLGRVDNTKRRAMALQKTYVNYESIIKELRKT